MKEMETIYYLDPQIFRILNDWIPHVEYLCVFRFQQTIERNMLPYLR